MSVGWLLCYSDGISPPSRSSLGCRVRVREVSRPCRPAAAHVQSFLVASMHAHDADSTRVALRVVSGQCRKVLCVQVTMKPFAGEGV